MTSSRRLAVLIGIVAAAAAVAAVAFAVPFTRGASHATTVIGPGMMNGYSGGMMGGGIAAATATGTPSSRALGKVRNQVDSWLGSRGFTGFRVSEVMAFARNDYVAVQDAKGKPAFELLTPANLRWLMEEPPSMMWNTRYGMMGGYGAGMMGGGMMGGRMMGGWGSPSWGGTGHPVSSTKAAVTVANRWLRSARPDERAERDAQTYPGYYTTDTVKRGKIVGMLSVNATTGAVWYHTWHGRFLAERQF